MREVAFRYIKTGILFALIWTLAYFYTSCSIRKAPGSDMSPAVPNESMTIVWTKEGAPDKVKTGDIVYYERPVAGIERNVFLARVIGAPGDRVKIEKGEPWVNGTKADVPNSAKTDETVAEFIVPRDTVYVMMDNRKHGQKYDSRAFGPIGGGSILGKVKK